jgi:hypothetical protein
VDAERHGQAPHAGLRPRVKVFDAGVRAGHRRAQPGREATGAAAVVCGLGLGGGVRRLEVKTDPFFFVFFGLFVCHHGDDGDDDMMMMATTMMVIREVDITTQ